MDLKTGCEGVDCIYLSQGSVKWRDFVNTGINLGVPERVGHF
jgi:hypothetical protein